MPNIICPTGFIDSESNCNYNLNNPNVRSRESVDPKTDLAFYFNEYIVPKYGLNNINVSNVASFMKDLEINWTKLDPPLKDKVMNILVDNILTGGNYDFRNALLNKLNIQGNNSPVGSGIGSSNSSPQVGSTGRSNSSSPQVGRTSTFANQENIPNPSNNSTFTSTSTSGSSTLGKESFGSSNNTNLTSILIIVGVLIVVGLILFFLDSSFKNKKVNYPFPKNQ
jgi:hypothetical protein